MGMGKRSRSLYIIHSSSGHSFYNRNIPDSCSIDSLCCKVSLAFIFGNIFFLIFAIIFWDKKKMKLTEAIKVISLFWLLLPFHIFMITQGVYHYGSGTTELMIYYLFYYDDITFFFFFPLAIYVLVKRFLY